MNPASSSPSSANRPEGVPPAMDVTTPIYTGQTVQGLVDVIESLTNQNEIDAIDRAGIQLRVLADRCAKEALVGSFLGAISDNKEALGINQQGSDIHERLCKLVEKLNSKKE